MTDPFDDPTGRWGLIFHGSGMYRRSHTRQEWAQIADAIRTADLLRAGTTRGDAAWCEVAADTYTRLHDAGAYAHLSPGDQPRWHADEHLIRAWLGAPVVPAGDEPATMLDAHGWQYSFDSGRTPDPADLTILVDLAQEAGVVGAPRHKVSLLRWVDGGVTGDDSFLILLWPPDGPARGSSPVGLDRLVPPPASSIVDRIVGVLHAVAAVANGLLAAGTDPAGPTTDRHRAAQPPPLAPGVDGYQIGKRGRPFQVINGGNGTPGSPPPPSALRMPRRPRT